MSKTIIRTILKMWKSTTTADKDQYGDVHTRLMKKNYHAVPQWWFQVILIVSLALSVYAFEGFDRQLQLPWWGLLLGCGMALIFTLPFGVIQATTNMVHLNPNTLFDYQICKSNNSKKNYECLHFF